MNIKVKVTFKNREMLIQNRKLIRLLEKSNLLVIEVKGKLTYGSIGYIKLKVISLLKKWKADLANI